LRAPVFGGIVRKRVLEGLGLDAVRFAATGSTPKPAELIDWYASLGIRISDIYGMTENAAGSHCVLPGQHRNGWAGSPMPGVVWRISEAAEILVKSPGTMVGYYKADHLTREAIDEDGFLRTGDRGGDGRRGTDPDQRPRQGDVQDQQGEGTWRQPRSRPGSSPTQSSSRPA